MQRSGMIATCPATGKRGYDKRGTAKRAITRSARHYDEPRTSWNAYRCDHCRLFHIGHRQGGGRG